MSSDAAPPPADAPEAQMDGSAYEIIRGRLQNHAKELRSRLDRLNEARKEVFGSIDTESDLPPHRSRICGPRGSSTLTTAIRPRARLLRSPSENSRALASK